MVRRIYHLTKSSVSYRLEIMLSFLTRPGRDRKSTRLNSSHLVISYAVFCLKKKKFNEIKRKRIMSVRYLRMRCEDCSIANLSQDCGERVTVLDVIANALLYVEPSLSLIQFL